MSTLLESRINHRHVRLLPRKARESEIINEEPLRRRLPLLMCPETNNDTDELTRRQRSQRERRRKEKELRTDELTRRQRSQRELRRKEKELRTDELLKNNDGSANVCFSNIFAHSPVVENALEQSSSRFRRRQGQQRRRERERSQRTVTSSTVTMHNERSRLVCMTSTACFTFYSLHLQIMPSDQDPNVFAPK